MEIKKPVLVVGMGLSVLVGFSGVLGDVLRGFPNLAILSIVTVSTALWLSKRSFKPSAKIINHVIGKIEVEREIKETQTLLNILKLESKDLLTLQERLSLISNSLNRSVTQIFVTGGQKVGKSSLKNALKLSNLEQQLNWLETDSLLRETQIDQGIINYLSLNADLTLFLINGDLTESEYCLIQQLLERQIPLILVFNKQDQYLPEERVLILDKLEERLKAAISPKDIVGISATPVPIVVRKVQNGSVEERIVYLQEEIKPLETRLKQRLIEEGEELIYKNTWRQVKSLKKEAKEVLNQVRKKRALPIIEKYKWLVALAVLANPIPVVDCLINATFSTQMIVEINEIYQQKLLPKHSKIILVTLTELMVKLGLVELTTQSMINILKTNAITYLAVGSIQAFSAAYWTNIAGLSVIEYLQEYSEPITSERPLDVERLKDKFQEVWSRMQKKEVIENFLIKGVSRLSSGIV